MDKSKVFSYPFFFSSSSGAPIIRMLVCLILSQRSLRLSSVLFILFPLFCSLEVISTILSSSSLIHFSASDILLLIPSRVFLISELCCLSLYVYSLVLLSSVQFSHSVVSDSLRPHESQHIRPPCPSPTPGVHPDSGPSSQ